MSNQGLDMMLVVEHDLQSSVSRLVDAKMVPLGEAGSGQLTIGISNAVQMRDSLALAV